MRRTWAETQADFAAAILDTELPPPAEVIDCSESRGRSGFAVHRNNSLAGLVDALQERFPVTCRLVGEEFFRAMARLYVNEHPPRSPLLMHYGDDLPSFIDLFRPAKDVPYLCDVARLEAARSHAYHAPEYRSLQLQELASTPLESFTEMCLTLHPSTRILRSLYPVADIWTAHQHPAAVTPPSDWDAQDVLIVRPDAQVQLRVLGPGVYAFVRALLDHRCVQDAAQVACADSSQFNPGRSLVDLFGLGAVVAFGIADTQET